MLVFVRSRGHQVRCGRPDPAPGTRLSRRPRPRGPHPGLAHLVAHPAHRDHPAGRPQQNGKSNHRAAPLRVRRSPAPFRCPQIHKTAQGALLALLEQGLLPPRVVEEKLVPLVVSWCSVDDAELNTSAVGVSTIYYVSLGLPLTFSVMFLSRTAVFLCSAFAALRKTCVYFFGGCSACSSISYVSKFIYSGGEIWISEKSHGVVFLFV